MKVIAIKPWVLAAFAILFASSSAHAAFVVLTGTVQDQSGVGIAGVQIDFVDSCTAVLAGATGNITSATGTFSATVNSGIYDLEIRPPAGTLYAAYRMLKYDLTISRTLGIVKLANGVAVSGHVTDTGGAPLSAVYLHFFVPNGGGRVYTVRDKTDALGNYSIVVAPGTYELRYGPHSGTPYLAQSAPPVSITGPLTLPTVALQTGFAVSGTILDSVGVGNPVINVNINAIDTDTGAAVLLSHDRTDVNGFYSVSVPAGRYVIAFEPEKCTHLAGAWSAATSVSADTSIATVQLPAGVLVQGLVTDTNGAPVFDVNTDYFNAAGAEIVASDDHTDAAGAFNTYLPPGTYAITYSPPRGLRLAGVKSPLLGMTANPTTVPTVILPAGFFMSGRVVTSDGVPVPNVQMTFLAAGTTTQVYVAHNSTDATGSFSIVSVPRTYDIRFTPPTSAGLVTVTRPGVVVASDMTLTDTVLPYPAPAVTSISPGTGSTAGSQLVTVTGTGFRALASLALGGVQASVTSVASTTITATTPAHPPGTANVTVTNADGQSGTLTGAFVFQEPAIPIALRVTRSGADVVLTWTSTGQAVYTVFGNNTPNGWTNGSILSHTAATSYTVVGGALTSGNEYFSVE